ncbi:hypothetical protein LEP1GSC079_4445 [Leptospira interrogans str. FPW1039]|uniref:Uncharacterized protein n=3 Tax=Leptospira interrogans TaxID=173 RepID=A0A0F6H981_LEPIR|nr:hypothetical protein G436_4696 [Leptospira interrogans serovar Hardjo str. Norma]EKO24820.1 hypothetical protein LEP1GSC104_0325 [Leptospira interrogans str. UI 12621]EMJ38700.1 hypothetical protein LEP1GSC079_4445 [Leptospira interrogans str. FPW1039]
MPIQSYCFFKFESNKIVGTTTFEFYQFNSYFRPKKRIFGLNQFKPF